MKFTFIKFFLAFGILLSGLSLSAQCGTDADLSLAYSVSLMTPDSGQTINYTVVVNNDGPCDASNVNVRVTGTAANSAFYNGMNGPGTQTVVSSNLPNLLWSGFSIPQGSSVTLTFSGKYFGTGFYTTTAQVDASAEPDPDSTPGNSIAGEDDQQSVTVQVFHWSCGAGNTSPAPPNVTIVNSTCSVGCIPAGGSISPPGGTPCPSLYTLNYSLNGGPWSAVLPVYDQDGPAQSISTRCQCNTWPSDFTPASTPVTTVPGTCTIPTCNIAGSATICPLSTGNIYSGTPGMASYSWGIMGDAVIVGSTSDPDVTVTAGSTGNFTLTLDVVSMSGCTTSCNLPGSMLTTFTTVNNGPYNDPNTWAFMCMPPNPLPPGAMVSIQSAVTNPPGNTLVNNGTIDLGPGGTFINYGIYKGNGTLIGTMDNQGSVIPGQ